MNAKEPTPEPDWGAKLVESGFRFVVVDGIGSVPCEIPTRFTLEQLQSQAYRLGRIEGMKEAKAEVDAEPELPGPMPERNKRAVEAIGIEESLRATVRGTKAAISKRITARLAELEAQGKEGR